MKIRVAVLFGGKSVEHEVSVISGIQALEHLDRQKYDPVPVYISRDNQMYIGADIGKIDAYRDIPGLLARSQRVIFSNQNGEVFLTALPSGKTTHQIDVAMPVVHGTNEEDGVLQGHLRTVGVPFTGCDVAASAIGMDKAFQKTIVREAGVPVLDGIVLYNSDYRTIEETMARCEREIGFPLIVKPACLGSSVGIGIAKNRSELEQCLDNAFSYADKILVERAVTDLREINCSVLGDVDDARASVCEEPMHTGTFLTYEDKYGSGGGGAKDGTKGVGGNAASGANGASAGAASGGSSGSGGGQSQGMVELSRIIPAPISDEMTAQIQDYSVRAFRAMNCAGVVRIDYILDSSTGEVFLNEINTIPGSLAFYLWEATGMKYPQLLDELIRIALRRHRNEDALSFSFETHILDNRKSTGTKKV